MNLNIFKPDVPQTPKPQITDLGDITQNVSSGTPITNAEGQYMQNMPENVEHSLLWLIDQGVEQSKSFCAKAELPEPATAIYENFSRPLLNKAMLHYVPDSNTPQNPFACLLLGVAGLAACYVPVYIAYKQKDREAPQEEDKPRNEVSIQNAVKPQAQAQAQAAEETAEQKPTYSDLVIEKFSVNSGMF